MGCRIHNIRHPKRNICSHADLRPDGRWEFPDGTIVEESELRGLEDDGFDGLMLIVGVVVMLLMWAFS